MQNKDKKQQEQEIKQDNNHSEINKVNILPKESQNKKESLPEVDQETIQKRLSAIQTASDIKEYTDLLPHIKKKTELSKEFITVFLKASINVNKSLDFIKIMIQFKNDDTIISFFIQLSSYAEKEKEYFFQNFFDYEDSLFVLSEYLSKDLEICFNYLSQISQFLICALYPIFSLVLHILSKNSKLKDAKMLLDYLMHNKLEISTCAINNFIDALCKDSQLENAQSLFEILTNYKPELIFPESSYKFNKYILGHGVNIVTYGTFIKWLCKSNNMDLAMYYYTFLKDGKYLKDEIIYNLIIDGCAKKGDLGTIKSVYFSMLNDSIKPTIVTFNTIIDAFVRAKDLDSAWKIFEDLLKNNIQPDNFTLSTLFRGIRLSSHRQYLLKGLDIVKKISVENNKSADIILINVLLDSCIALKESELLIKLFKEVTSGKVKDVAPDLITYNTFIKGCAQMGIYEEVMPAFDNMCLNKSVTPNDVTFNTLIDVFVRSKDMNKVWFIISKMKETGIKPDNFTYSTIIKGLNKNTSLNCSNDLSQEENELDLAFKLFENVKKNSKPDEILYNCIMDACLRFGKIDKMLELYENMLFEGIKPSSITCGIVIKAYGMKGNIENAIQVYEQMKSEKIEISSVTFGCLINACIKNNKMEKAFELYEELQQNGFEMNTILYTTLIKAYSKSKNLPKVLSIFNKMKQNSNNMPNNITYNSVIDCCLKNDDFKLADTLFNEMCKLQDVKPDIITFSTIIKGALRNKNFEQAMNYLNIMLKMQIKPDDVFLNSLLDGCEKLNQYEKAIYIFNTIKGLGVEPTMMSYSIMMKILGKLGNYEFSKILMEEVKSKKKNLSLIIFTCYIKTCFSTGHLEEACDTFSLLDSFKLEPDCIAYSTIIKGITNFYCNNDYSEYLVDIIKQSIRKNISLPRYLYVASIKYLKSYQHYDLVNSLGQQLKGCNLLFPKEYTTSYKQNNYFSNNNSNIPEMNVKTPVKSVSFFNANYNNASSNISDKVNNNTSKELNEYSSNEQPNDISKNDHVINSLPKPNYSNLPLNAIWERRSQNYMNNYLYSNSTKTSTVNQSNYPNYNYNADTAKKSNHYYMKNHTQMNFHGNMPVNYNNFMNGKIFIPNSNKFNENSYYVNNYAFPNFYYNYNNFNNNYKKCQRFNSKVISINQSELNDQSQAKKENVEKENVDAKLVEMKE